MLKRVFAETKAGAFTRNPPHKKVFFHRRHRPLCPRPTRPSHRQRLRCVRLFPAKRKKQIVATRMSDPPLADGRLSGTPDRPATKTHSFACRRWSQMEGRPPTPSVFTRERGGGPAVVTNHGVRDIQNDGVGHRKSASHAQCRAGLGQCQHARADFCEPSRTRDTATDDDLPAIVSALRAGCSNFQPLSAFSFDLTN